MIIKEHWFRVHSNPQFIAEPQAGKQVFIPEEADNLLLVDSDILVDFFVRNEFLFQQDIAIMSTRHLSLVAKGSYRKIFFLHGSGKHIELTKKSLSVIDIGWTENEVKRHPSFEDFVNKDQLPVDLLSPKELLDSTAYSIQNHVGILRFFES